MTKLTKEQLIAEVHYNLEHCFCSEKTKRLMEIALAALTAEPIGAFHIAGQQVDGTSDYIKDGEWPVDNGVIEVYHLPLLEGLK